MEERNEKQVKRNRIIIIISAALVILLLILLLSIKSCHKHEYTSAVTEPTCTETGFTTYTCKCGDSYVSDETEAKGHTYSDWKVVKEATETETGLKEKTCIICNDKVTEEISKLSHTHNYTETVVDATCTEKGYKEYTCTCGDTYKEEIEALGHTEVEVAGKEATCTKAGKTTGKKCSVCGEVTVPQTDINPLGHTYGEWKVVKEATETETGLKERKCNICNELETQTIPTLSHTHSYTSVATNPTCVDKGYTTYTCTCGDSYKDNEVNALGHTYSDWKVVKEATETETGLKEKECSVCNDKVTEEISKLEHIHSYTTTITEPTCVDKGYTTYTCSCGDSYISNETDVLDHTYTSVVTEPTCISEGYTTYTCSCGDTYKDDYTEIIEHEYKLFSKREPTCTEVGAISYKCDMCGDISLEIIDMIDHNYVSGKCECGDILMGTPFEENGYTYIYFGQYPQTVVTDESIISSLSTITTTNSKGYIEYNGNEYTKTVADTFHGDESNNVFFNGEKITNGKTYYFIVEPLKWRIFNEDADSYYLLCNNVIDVLEYYNVVETRIINGQTIYPSNYEYSNIRAWLNGYNGSSYNVNDYTNKGFLDIAFKESERNLIKTTEVDNSLESTTHIFNDYLCNDTNDKVYILSYADTLKAEYGFVPAGNFRDKLRQIKASDYTRCINGYISTGTSNVGSSIWWLRSPDDTNENEVHHTQYFGYSFYVSEINSPGIGACPAITIKK